MNFELVMPTQDDANLIREWRNDPDVLKVSFSYREERTLEQFYPEFLEKYFSYPELPPLFVIYEGERIGNLRFDPAGVGCCEISIVMAKEERNKGYGQRVLLAIEPFLLRQQIFKVFAKINKGNVASIKTFKNTGYEEIGSKGDFLLFEKVLKKVEDSSIFIIGEAGSNWNGGAKDFDRALALIEAAKNAGCNAVKFQTFTPEETYVKNPGVSDYLAEGGISQDIGEMFKSLTLPKEWIAKLAQHCKDVGIEFMSSVFSKRDFDLIDPYVIRHKIASYEISHLPLIELVAKSKKPLILSTGASTADDIDVAVNAFRKAGGVDLTLLQCTAKYPAPLHAMHLKVIPWLKARYQCRVGLSDHSVEPFTAPLIAVALGAEVIEKHFTLDRSLPGPDHFFSLEPNELKEMVEKVYAGKEALGQGLKTIDPIEEELYSFARRGLQALVDIQTGDTLKIGENVGILRPGKKSMGAHPKYLPLIVGKKVLRSIRQGEGILIDSVENNGISL